MGLLPHVPTSSFGAAEQSAVFISALLGLAASTAFLFHTVVFRGLVGQFWKALTSRLQWSDPTMREEVEKKLRAESLHHACCMNFFVTAWCTLNLGVIVLNIASGADRWQTVWQDVVWIFATFACIICQLALRRRQHHLTVNAVFATFMIWQTLIVSMGPAEQVPFIAVAGFSVLTRGLWSLVCMRLPVVACFTALHFLCVCVGFVRTDFSCTEDGGLEKLESIRLFVSCEFIGDSTIVLCTVVWRHFCRLRILHEIQASISQSENEAARSLLNIVCDATVELDGQLQIMDETPRLASLLQHGRDRSLKGSSMLQFVMEEDRQLFTDRISSASDECMANVFHMRVRDGISNVLKMEVFHVPVTGFLRADSHLIGVREYADVTENVGTLSGAGMRQGSRGPDGRRGGAQRAGEAATDPGRARAADVEPWSSSSLPPSANSSSGGEGEVVAWIEVLSERWEISSCTSGFELFWSGGARAGRNHRTRELLEWVKPDQREPLIGWVQASYQEMRALRGTEPAHSPAARYLQRPVCFRPPSLWHVKAKIAYAASIALALPEEHQNQSTLARLTFSDIRVVQQSSAPNDL